MSRCVVVNSFPEKVMLLRHKNSFVGVRKGINQYVVGFFKPSYVHLAKRVIDTSRDLYLEAASFDVSNDVNDGLESMGVGKKVSDLSVDINAKLTIPVVNEPVGTGVDVEFYKTSDFIMLPFEKRLGVVIAEELQEAKDSHWIWTCQVIDPCEDVEHFRNNLKM